MGQLQLFATDYMEYPAFRTVLKLVCYRRIIKKPMVFQTSTNLFNFSGDWGQPQKSPFYTIKRTLKTLIKKIRG